MFGLSRLQGTVKFYAHDKKFGFVTADPPDGRDFYFREAALDGRDVVAGDPVEFEYEDAPRGPRCVTVRPL
jgi:cold shock CspA family protein